MCEHKYIFLRKEVEEKTWHNFVDNDVFFCEKCLEYKKIEQPKPHRY